MEKEIQEFIIKTSTNSSVANHYLNLADGDVEQAIQLYQVTKPKSSRIATFSDLQRGETPKEEQGQTFFAGGEKSGVSIQQPANPKNLVKDILEIAAKSKGQDPEEGEEASSASYFTGAGYKLGTEQASSSSTTQTPSNTNPINNGATLPTAEKILTFWKDGFSIDDGPLMRYDAPENQEFLELIKSGIAPIKYLNVQPGQKVEIKVAHKMEESYVAPAKKLDPFSGQGNRLGSIIPGETSRSTQAPSNNVPANVPTLSVDSTSPTTSIQIRLADGTRLVVKCNHHHQIQDLYSFIKASRPGEAGRSFQLQTTLPVRVLTQLDETVKDAGLLNSVIVQRYI